MIYFRCRKTKRVYFPVENKDLRHLLRSGFLKIPDCECVHGCDEQKRQVKACSKYVNKSL